MITQICPECGIGKVRFGELSRRERGSLEWTDACTSDECDWEHTGIEA